MPSLKTLRNRIASVKATQKITKAMQMVAASKLRRAQAAAEAARPYAARMAAVLANVAAGSAGSADAPRLLVGTGQTQTHLLVVATGDRGLSGAFNSSIARMARDHARRLMADGKDVKLLCVGRKGYEALRRTFPRQIVEVIELRSVKQIGFINAEEIGARVLALFAEGQFDVATLFYAEFRSVISQVPTARQLVPAEVTGAAPAAATRGAVYEYEPDEESILADLLPRWLTRARARSPGAHHARRRVARRPPGPAAHGARPRRARSPRERHGAGGRHDAPGLICESQRQR